ncbi:MAG: RNA polymerase sigma factor [Acidimicrobiales bacterium]
MIATLAHAPVSLVVATDSSFESFYRVEAPGLYRALSLAIGDSELAREATDEGFVRAYQNWRKIQHYDNPAGWVYRVSLNWARSRIRKTKREVITDEVSQSTFEHSNDPALTQALETLPIEFRSVVVLRYLLQWSTSEVAEALGVPLGTVKSRLSRALDQLRVELGEDDG